MADHTLVELALNSREEAFYVTGVLNSTPFGLAAASYIVLHPDSHILENLRVPTFDPTSTLHRDISSEAYTISNDPAQRETPINERLDALCSKLWGIDDKGLKAIQDAYRDLYLADTKAEASSAGTL